MSMEGLQDRIGYRFRDPSLLERALTHSSYANECKQKTECNERMEFLGDAVLSIIVADHIFHKFHLAEGDLTKIRASLVCEKSLYEFARKIDLGSELLLGHGEEQTGGRERPSVVSDAFEALIAAIYLDGGLEKAAQFVLPFVEEDLGHEVASFFFYKTRVQEIIQKNPEERVEYVLVSAQGPDHDKKFVVEVHLNSNVIGRGVSRSKKGAGQGAGEEALSLMGEI